MFDLTDLFVLFLFALAGLYWYSAAGMKQLALSAARDYCKKMDLQLLDESVALRALWFKRSPDGQLRVWRSYNFDFTSTGDDRYQGRIILLGKQITHIHTPAYRVEEPWQR